MAEQTECKHESFKVDATVSFLADVKRYYMDVTVKCVECGLPFHFIAPDYGMRVDRPALNPDATELRCPIGPGPAALPPMGTPMLFEVPGTPKES